MRCASLFLFLTSTITSFDLSINSASARELERSEDTIEIKTLEGSAPSLNGDEIAQNGGNYELSEQGTVDVPRLDPMLCDVPEVSPAGTC